jgi:hypothetical protein
VVAPRAVYEQGIARLPKVRPGKSLQEVMRHRAWIYAALMAAKHRDGVMPPAINTLLNSVRAVASLLRRAELSCNVSLPRSAPLEADSWAAAHRFWLDVLDHHWHQLAQEEVRRPPAADGRRGTPPGTLVHGAGGGRRAGTRVSRRGRDAVAEPNDAHPARADQRLLLAGGGGDRGGHGPEGQLRIAGHDAAAHRASG